MRNNLSLCLYHCTGRSALDEIYGHRYRNHALAHSGAGDAGGIIHQCCKQASMQLAVEVCVYGRVDAQAYCSFASADAVNLYAAVLHKSVMRVDIFYASDNFFRLHKSFLL